MSVQFGRWNFDGQSVDPDYMARARAILAAYAPDGTSLCVKGPFFIVYGAFHAMQESRGERQPFVSPSGTFLTWNGRLDNRSQLIARLSQRTGGRTTDLDIVSTLYEAHGAASLGQLIGDWSLSALHYYDRALVLAADFLGTHPLYYFRCDRYVAWSTVLEALVLLADEKLTLCQDYLASWLFGFPAASLTPYREIQVVPPASFVKVTNHATSVAKHWTFRPAEARLKDSEYEDRFRYLFTQAVHRRLRSAFPVAAELSGGMDSSSIVCVADRILEESPATAPRLDTVSYLDDTEPDWNERPFIEAVETLRKRPGFHIDVSMPPSFIPEREQESFPGTPAAAIAPSVPQQKVAAFLREEDIRVVLSGLGGDECTGGAPDGSSELADLLVRGRFTEFFHQGVAWCLAGRRPLLHVTAGVIAGFLPHGLVGPSLLRTKVPWLTAEFERRHRENAACQPLRLKLHGPLPSFQENLHTLEDLRRQIACAPLPAGYPRERRYPFLDRDLLEFLYNIPRELIVRPGRRRALLRSALRGIVPDAVLERKRKAYVARGPLKSIHAESERLKAWTKEMICADIGAIDLPLFQQSLAAACRGEGAHLWRLSRALALESWLRDDRIQSVICLPETCQAATGLRIPRHRDSHLEVPDEKGGTAHEIREAGSSLCG